MKNKKKALSKQTVKGTEKHNENKGFSLSLACFISFSFTFLLNKTFINFVYQPTGLNVGSDDFKNVFYIIFSCLVVFEWCIQLDLSQIFSHYSMSSSLLLCLHSGSPEHNKTHQTQFMPAYHIFIATMFSSHKQRIIFKNLSYLKSGFPMPNREAKQKPKRWPTNFYQHHLSSDILGSSINILLSRRVFFPWKEFILPERWNDWIGRPLTLVRRPQDLWYQIKAPNKCWVGSSLQSSIG